MSSRARAAAARDDVESEAVEEVAPEALGAGEAGQVLVGGAERCARRSRSVSLPADALELAVLDDAQDLLLHAQRNGAELVEEKRAAVRLLEASDVTARRRP